MTYKGLIKNLTNDNYHGEKEHFSSSQLKDVLEDIEYFYKVHISKEIEKSMTGNQLAIGTYVHTAVLEPHLLNKECAVYTGATRRGKEWEAFQALNTGKTIITAKESEDAAGCIKAVLDDAESMKILTPAEKEVSTFGQLLGVPLKARFDAGLLKDGGYIADLKTCSCNAKEERAINRAIEDYNYDMSAALYLDLFSITSGKRLKDFYWVFASKKMNNAQVWRATPEMLATGRAKLKYALTAIRKYAEMDWAFKSEIRDITPPPYIKDMWLPKQETSKDSELL